MMVPFQVPASPRQSLTLAVPVHAHLPRLHAALCTPDGWPSSAALGSTQEPRSPGAVWGSGASAAWLWVLKLHAA